MLRISRVPPFLLTLAAGAVGGAAAAVVNLPLAWMLGALWVVVLLSAWKTPPQPPRQLRRLALAVIGCYLGGSFTPSFFSSLTQAPFALMMTTLVTVSTFTVGFFALKRLLNVDSHTALFGSMPGGLSLLIALASTYRGDKTVVVTVQVVRIISVASIIPLWSRFVAGDAAVVAAAAADIAEPYGLWWLLLVFFAAAAAGMLLRSAQIYMMAAIFFTAVLYVNEFTAGAPPPMILAGAQVVLGASVGASLGLKELISSGKTAVVGVTMAILYLAVCALFAAAAAAVSDIGFLVWLLAFAPGGIAEICLTAQLLDLNPTFVLTMQVLRLLLVVVCTPLLARWLRHRATV